MSNISRTYTTNPRCRNVFGPHAKLRLDRVVVLLFLFLSLNAGAQTTLTGSSYEVKTEEARETTVQVYFTNGKGTFYTITPEVVLTDTTTKKVVAKFSRTVDAYDSPEQQTGIPAGTYDLTLAGRRGFLVSGVKIEQNKSNKIIITVAQTTLRFAYKDAPERPVTEFTAIVTERSKQHGNKQEQKCSEAIKCDPGSYHIEINTFPKIIRNVDIDFGEETVITIQQPGYARFTGDEESSVHSVTLYQEVGDRFYQFYTMDLYDAVSHNPRVQPGKYEAHYQKGAGQNRATEQVKQFVVKPAETTEVILN